MSFKFLLQGLTSNTHINEIENLFQIEDIKLVIISVAFVSSGGVKLLSPLLQKNSNVTTVYAGIRNGITSAQAIKELAAIGVNLNTVDTGATDIVFHPKIYYVRGTNIARLIVGSANLTSGGLRGNIEASASVDLNLENETDLNMCRAIESEFHALSHDYKNNVASVPNGISLAQLLADPRLVDASLKIPLTGMRGSRGESDFADEIPRIRLKTPKIYSSLNKPLPNETFEISSYDVNPHTPRNSFRVVWVSKPLVARDLNIPENEDTNPTGSMGFKKGAMGIGFDQRHYFRDEVFNYLSWEPARTIGKFDAYAKFRIIIIGVDHGEFDLLVNHDSRTHTTTYKQRNFMTQISWGPIRSLIANQNLLGRTLHLLRATEDPSKFMITID